MAIDFAVFTKFNAIDRVSKAFKTMGSNADKFGNRADKAFLKASRAGNRFRDVTKGILAAGAISRSLGALESGLRGATSEFVNFDQAVTSASAKFKGLDLTTKAGQKTLERLKKTARDVGAVTQFSATQAAEGLDFLALAGFNAEQAMSALPGVVDLATVANVDLATATDIASDSLGAFGLMTEDSAKLTKNLSRVNDVFAKTTATANTNLEALFESAKKGGPTFTAAGQSLESFSALVGVMANAGVKGEESGTQLRNVMLRLADPVKEAQKVLDKLGISTKDQSGNFRDVVDILADFEKGLEGMGTQQRTAALATVFGARSVTGINILLKEGTGRIREYRKSLEDAGGAAKKMADIMRGSILNRLKSLQSALIELTFKVFTKFEKRGGSAIDSIVEEVRKFNPQMIIDGIEGVIDVFSTLKKEGVIDAFTGFLKNSIFLMAQLFTVAKKVFDVLADAGVFKVMATGLKILGGALKFVTELFKALLHIATPILDIVAKIASIPMSILSMAGAGITDILGLTTGGGEAVKSPSDAVAKSAEAFQASAEPPTPLKPVAPVAPNAKEAEARAQNVNFMGRLDIAGAPDGSKFTPEKRSAPGIDVALMGAQ
jgi:TP901 family phage tail tape measure protein